MYINNVYYLVGDNILHYSKTSLGFKIKTFFGAFVPKSAFFGVVNDLPLPNLFYPYLTPLERIFMTPSEKLFLCPRPWNFLHAHLWA